MKRGARREGWKGAHLILIRLLLQSGVINKVGTEEGAKTPPSPWMKIFFSLSTVMIDGNVNKPRTLTFCKKVPLYGPDAFVL